MKPITIYTANRRGDKFNTFYPEKRIISSVVDLTEAAHYDQVFATYEDCHRTIANFICSDCLSIATTITQVWSPPGRPLRMWRPPSRRRGNSV